jgi:hypothetical protein
LGTEVFHADRQADMIKLIVNSYCFVNAPKRNAPLTFSRASKQKSYRFAKNLLNLLVMGLEDKLAMLVDKYTGKIYFNKRLKEM